MWMDSADNVEISKSRFQRAGKGLQLAKPVPECSGPAWRLGTADQPASPDCGALRRAAEPSLCRHQVQTPGARRGARGA